MVAGQGAGCGRRRDALGRRRYCAAPGPRLPTLVLALVLALVWMGPAADTLDMKIFASPKNVLLNTEVFLECKITGFKAPLDLENVGVQWLFGPHREEIYVFIKGQHMAKKPGVKLSVIALTKGDATLHLNNVQVDNEGNYTCIVFVTPEKAEKRSELRVLAQPKLHLSTHVTIQTGAEKLVRCDATGFYPQEHNIYWEKVSKNKTEKLSHDVFITPPVRNVDGTFNVSSRMRIEATLADDGNVYKCVVEHPSHPDHRSLELKLTVNEPEKHLSAGALAGVVVAAIVLYALLGLGLFAYFLKFRKAPPEITGNDGHQTMKHLEKEMVTWRVSPFRPRGIIINLYLKRKGDQERTTILHSDSRKSTENRNGIINGEGHNEMRILMNSNWVDASFTPLDPEYNTNIDGISSAMIKVEIYPDVDKDEGAELTIEVQHKSLKRPISKTLILNVKGVPPKVLNIFKPSCSIHNESMSLICSITGFKPRPLRIAWHRKRKNRNAEEIVRMEEDNRTIIHGGDWEISTYKHYISEMEHDDKSYSITSELVIVPDIQQDQDSLYICKVHHSSTNIDQETEISLMIAAIPKLDSIKWNAEKTIAGVPLRISCQIHAFYPREISVKWLKDGEETVQDCNVAEPVIGQDGLYHVTSDVEIVPTWTEATVKYTCQVTHPSLTQPLHTDWVAGEMVSLPELTAIEVDPPCPETGKEVTLSCKAYGFYPEGNHICWFKGFDKIQDALKAGITLGKSELDTENGWYSCSSKWKFRPTADDHGRVFKMEVFHSETSSNPKTSSYTLKLKGIPYINDIKYEPPVAAYGSEHLLVCKVDNFNPKEIRTSWLCKGKAISTGVEDAGTVEDENGCFQMESHLRIKPTALHFGEMYSFQVKHSELHNPITKQVSLNLPVLSPTLSPITSDPAPGLLKVKQAVNLCVSLTSYVPAQIQVTWFQDGMICEGGLQTPPEIADDGLFSSKSSITLVAEINDHGSCIKCQVLHMETSDIQEKDFQLLLEDCGKIENDVNGGVDEAVCGKIENDVNEEVDEDCGKIENDVNGGVDEAVCGKIENDVNEEVDEDCGKIENDVNGGVDEAVCGKIENDVNEEVDEDCGKIENDVNGGVDEVCGKIENDVNEEVDEEALKVVSKITCHPEKPKAGHPVMLSCDARGSCIEEAHIIWYKDTYPFDELRYVTNTPFENEVGFTTTLTYTPKETDGNCIQVFIDVNLEDHMRNFKVILS
ncbi:uncharacterized protein LOC144602191 isoform X2 [Rhinoraja longicauda]